MFQGFFFVRPRIIKNFLRALSPFLPLLLGILFHTTSKEVLWSFRKISPMGGTSGFQSPKQFYPLLAQILAFGREYPPVFSSSSPQVNLGRCFIRVLSRSPTPHFDTLSFKDFFLVLPAMNSFGVPDWNSKGICIPPSRSPIPSTLPSFSNF